jgi:hypothetical protein
VNRAAQHQERAVQRQERVQRREQAQPKRPSAVQSKSAQPAAVQSKAAAQPAAAQAQTLTRTQQRAERKLRRQEDRALRNTPKSQRAAKREEIQRTREQRASGRQQATPNALTAQPNGAVQTNAQTRAQRRADRAARRAARGLAPVTAQAARQGRFASAFAGTSTRANRGARQAARSAWRQGLRAAFVPWYGPVFWPYAYSDVFDYAFWPGGYDDGYWNYAYDDFVDSMFWGEDGPPAEYVSAEPSGSAASPAPRVTYAAVQELCKQPGSGVTAWPFADIEKKVGLNADQKTLLDDVRSAAKDAAAGFQASCPADNAAPLTPPGRLQTMTARLQATLQAVDTVKPALDKFYASLSDEQKERFNQLGPKSTANNAEAKAALPANAKACSDAKPGLTNLPIERIGDAVEPTDEQDAKLTALQDATDKAVGVLQAACPQDTPMTPPGRLDAMETRLKAMIEAANTVKPALEDFYGSLSSEQKARFNRIKEVAQTSGQSNN